MLLLFRIFQNKEPMVKKSLRQFTLMATATVTLLLGSVPLYAQTADVQQNLPN